VKRRVQAFVLLAIAVFVSGGFAARSLWSAAQRHSPSPATSPARDLVIPSPQGAEVYPYTPSARPSATPRRSESPASKRKSPSHSATPNATRSTTTAAPPTSGGTTAAGAESEAVRLTNVQRGCTALRVDMRLRTADRLHSADMRDRNYFDHDSPDGRSPWDRIEAAGYTTPGAANIAKGYPTAAAVIQGGMNSPGHRANILNCKLRPLESASRMARAALGGRRTSAISERLITHSTG
jgi:uncharacterized protein YkwD